jgi:MFS family permease
MSWRHWAYDRDLPALSVRRRELRTSLRRVTVAWMFGVVWATAASGAQFKTYARMLGFGDMAFGIMAAIPFAATFGQLIASVVIERTGLRKFQFLHCAAIHRLSWLVMAALPLLLGVPSDLAVTAALFVLGVSWFSEALSRPAWMTWMGDLIPRRIRGRYMARREQMATLVQVVVVVGIGILLDWAGTSGRAESAEAQPMLLWVICGIFGMAAVFGFIDIFVFRRVREVLPSVRTQPTPVAVDVYVAPRKNERLGGRVGYRLREVRNLVRSLLLEPLREEPVFRNYVGFGAMITFSVTVAAWYFWLLTTEFLNLSYLATNFLFLVVGPLAALAAAPLWGRLIDRWGRRPALILSTVGAIFSLVPWFFVRPDMTGPQFVADGINAAAGAVGGLVGAGGWQPLGPGAPVGAFLVVALGCAIGGATWTGLNNAQLSMVLGFADGRGRSRYVAASSVLISLGGVLGGLCGGLITQYAAGFKDFGPFLWNRWHLTFAVAGVVRAASLFWLIGLPDTRAMPMRYVMRSLSVNVYNAVSTRLFAPARVFGWGRRRKG